MPQITQGVHLRYGGTGSTPSWARISHGSGASQKFLCIKDFPDMDNAQKDQIEITTLCDSVHKYMDGLDNLPDELTFTCNYDADLYDVVAGYTAEAWWCVQIGGGDDSAGTYNIWKFKATARMILVGGGVGDVLEMRVALTPKSIIEKSTNTIS